MTAKNANFIIGWLCAKIFKARRAVNGILNRERFMIKFVKRLTIINVSSFRTEIQPASLDNFAFQDKIVMA